MRHHHHVSSRVVLMARHYHAAGWSVFELARLFGVSRDALSKAVNFRTHRDLVAPDGWVVPQLPVRPAPVPVQAKPRHADRPPVDPARVQRVLDAQRRETMKPPVLAHAPANAMDPREWEQLKARWREDEAWYRRNEAEAKRSNGRSSNIPPSIGPLEPRRGARVFLYE